MKQYVAITDIIIYNRPNCQKYVNRSSKQYLMCSFGSDNVYRASLK